MQKYQFNLLEGSTINGKFIGERSYPVVESDSRLSAYINFCNQILQNGRDVTIVEIFHNEKHTLGFASDEISHIREAGAPFNFGTPTNGFQIESLTECM